MKSLLGSLIAPVNQLPVPYAPTRSRTLSSIMRASSSMGSQLRTMESVGTLHAIVGRTSNATAQVEWKLWKKAASGLKEDRTEITSHAALDLWNRPNDFYTRQELVESVQQHLDLTGEGWLIAGRSKLGGSLPMELWPIRPDKMEPVPHATSFLAGYIYHGPDGNDIPLNVDDVVMLRMPNPMDPYRGLGPVQSILTDLDSHRYSAEWNRAFFLNSAEPGGIIEYDRRLSDDEWLEITSRWREQHQGVAQAHRVAVIEQGKWVDRKYTMRDMQFAELRNVSREVIREAFAFPLPMLGTVENVNRANADAAEVVFARWLVVPRLERFKGALNHNILPMYGAAAKNLEFDYENPVPEDREAENQAMKAKAETAKIYIDLGFTAPSVSEALELPDMEYEKPPPPPPPVLPGQPGEGGGGGDAPPDPNNPPDPVPPVSPDNRISFTTTRAAAKDPAADVDISHVQTAWEAELADLMAKWGDAVDDQIKAVADQISDVIAAGNLAALANIKVNTTKSAELLSAAMRSMAQTAAGHVVDEAAAQGVAIQPALPILTTLDDSAAVTTTLLGISLALSAAREAKRVHAPGMTGEEVAGLVTDHLKAKSDAEARSQLGGALTGAQNAARIATLKHGPVAALYASEANDNGTCKPCREVDGRWLGNTDGVDFDQLNKTYPDGGYVGCLGGVRCRGTVVGVWRSQTGEDDT